MSGSYTTLELSRADGIATLTMNRPEVLNAVSSTVFAELRQAFDAIAADGEVHVVVLQGRGRAFVAGADIKEMADMDRQAAEARSWNGMRVYDQIRHLPQPVIASVGGYALGAGMLLALACDMRVAAEGAEFGYPEIRLGIFPATGGTILLERLLGSATARYLCLSGVRFPARRAYELGIVNELVADDELAARTAELATTIAGYSPLALRELKGVLNASLERDFAGAREYEIEAYGRCFDSDDRREGMRAFLDKRPPRFTGR